MRRSRLAVLEFALLCTILFLSLSFARNIPAISSPKYKAVSGADVDTGLHGKLNEVRTRFSRGFGDLLPNHILSMKIKSRKKRGSPITYTEHHILTTARDDFWKGFRMLLTLGYSREFFLYSYLVGPLIGGGPKAWSAWPSTFDLPHDRKVRDRALDERRIVAVGRILSEITQETNPESESKIQARGKKNVEILNRALSCKDPYSWISAMENYVVTEKRHASKVFLKNCNGAIVKNILSAVGGTGLPNLFLINRLNCNEIANFLDRLSKSDEVLTSVKPQNLSDREVMMACRERGISPTSTVSGRVDLSEWLSTMKTPLRDSKQGKFLENAQNKRLALMGWYISREFKISSTSTLYRAISGAI